MLSIITGKPRAGKSFYTVTLQIDFLRYSKRPIYTNIPVNPDKMARYVAGRNKSRFFSILNRIHVYREFQDIREAREFKLVNPCFWQLCLSQKSKRGRVNILSYDKIMFFWRNTLPNSLVFLDESYQWMSSRNYRKEELQDQREQLLLYSRQHGHYKDDIFIISHSEADLDVHLRRGCNYLYIIRNAKYTNMFEWRWMRGFKWPVQFFMVNGYEYGEKTPSDTWNVFPDKFIFACYDSHSKAENLGKKVASSEAENLDTEAGFYWNLMRFIRQGWFGLVILVGFVIGGFVAYKGIRKLINTSSGDFGGENFNANAYKETLLSDQATDQKESTQGTEKKEQVKEHKVTMKTPRSIYWEDGFKLRVGDFYKVSLDGEAYEFKIKKIDRSRVLLSTSDGSEFYCLISGIRTY